MNKLTNLLYRVCQNPIAVKAFNTFWQAALAVLLVTGFKLDKVTLVAAAAAGLSAVKTALLVYLESRRG